MFLLILEPYVYNGPRSGVRMRTLANSPPLHQRSWHVLEEGSDLAEEPNTRLNQSQTAGEALHILRPLIHCKF